MLRQKPSAEQQDIIDCVKGGFNVLVDAVAGSGKTTTVLFLAAAVPHKKIVLFTYNARLKAETRERVRRLGLTNVEVHSYHSFGVAHYVNPCVTDTDLKNILKYNYPLKNNPVPHIVIMDETQDMTPLYFQFVSKALVDMTKMCSQLLILGDNLQCIYDFPQKGADLRFLTLADMLYASSYPWKKRNLRTSYRITKPMEYFINEMVLGYPRMKSVKESSAPVEYITGDIFRKMPEYIYRTVLELLEVYKPDDIFILAPSVRTHNESNPIKKLENILVKRGIPCYVPISDDSELKDEVLANKVVFSSFHQSKGLERKVVFVYNFNAAYFTYYAKDKDTAVCPNTMYVAITRAMERLYVCAEDNQTTPFAFVNMDKVGACVKRVVLDKPRDVVKGGTDDEGAKEVIPMKIVMARYCLDASKFPSRKTRSTLVEALGMWRIRSLK
jgi:superfamily I DNA/RNA helicase